MLNAPTTIIPIDRIPLYVGSFTTEMNLTTANLRMVGSTTM
jgi:hypothetical protein